MYRMWRPCMWPNPVKFLKIEIFGWLTHGFTTMHTHRLHAHRLLNCAIKQCYRVIYHWLQPTKQMFTIRCLLSAGRRKGTLPDCRPNWSKDSCKEMHHRERAGQSQIAMMGQSAPLEPAKWDSFPWESVQGTCMHATPVDRPKLSRSQVCAG